MINGKNGINLFLVDRSETKSRWWTADLTNVMIFRRLESAQTQANKLRFKNPQVVDWETAKEIVNNQYRID